MMVGKYILSIDQGTTSSRAVLFDAFGGVAGMGQREFPQIYPQPGYVEHDAVQILQTTLYAMRQAVEQAGIRARDIAAISITNQRETTVAWDAVTGIPVCNAIVWQCRRTAPECERLRAAGMEGYIKDTTGLLIDPYFSGTKMKWILENVPAARDLAKKGRLRFGTIDTWLEMCIRDRRWPCPQRSCSARGRPPHPQRGCRPGWCGGCSKSPAGGRRPGRGFSPAKTPSRR